MTPVAPARPEPPPVHEDEMRAFLLVVREALLVVVRYIERRYRLSGRKGY